MQRRQVGLILRIDVCAVLYQEPGNFGAIEDRCHVQRRRVGLIPCGQVCPMLDQYPYSLSLRVRFQSVRHGTRRMKLSFAISPKLEPE
jgi:hypothetical protein